MNASRLALLVMLVAAAGCWRVAAPPATDATVRIEIANNDARLVRAQAELQGAVAKALTQRLGWTVSPMGANRLVLSVAEETVDAVSGDRNGITGRWRITLHGSALYESASGTRSRAWSGSGYTSALGDEPAALTHAAEQVATELAAWLALDRPDALNAP